MERRAALFVRRGGLGDTLLIAPVLAAWRMRVAARDGNDVALHVAGVREFADVLARYGACDATFSSEDFEIFALSTDGERGARAKARFARYCAVIGDDPALLQCGVAEVAIYDPRPRDETTLLSAQIAAQLGLELAAGPFVLGSGARENRGRGGAIVFAPGSGASQKCWPRDHWLDLAARLVGAGERIDVVVGPAESERDDPRCWPWTVPVRFVADRSCSEVAAELERAAAFVGNDSGVTHLASMLGVPTVAVFGGGLPCVYAPIGPRTEIVVTDGSFPPNATVDRVAAAIARVRR
jgi:heptosyltransferase-3